MEKSGSLYAVGGNVISSTTVEDGVVILKDLEPEIQFDPEIPLLGIYAKEYK